jgi:hypothetical protein
LIEEEKMIHTRRCTFLLLALALLLGTACAKRAEQPTPAGNSQLIAANESAAISTLRTISSAQTAYQAVSGNGSYGTLKQLADAQLVDAQLGSGEKNGYRFQVKLTSPSSYEVVATPAQYGITGRNSFYISSHDVVIHSADKRGAEATASDPIL